MSAHHLHGSAMLHQTPELFMRPVLESSVRTRLRGLRFVREQLLPGSGSSEHQATGAIPPVSRQYRFCWPPLRRTETRNLETVLDYSRNAFSPYFVTCRIAHLEQLIWE
jgi:hypothetical protein